MLQNPLRTLIESCNAMALRYRTWAEQTTGSQALEYLRLAESTEKTASELQEIESRRRTIC